MHTLLFILLATAAGLIAWGIGAAIGSLIYRVYWWVTGGSRGCSERFRRTLRIARAARERGRVWGRAAEQKRLEARAAAVCRVIDYRITRVNGEAAAIAERN